jgi:hypothetical protein
LRFPPLSFLFERFVLDEAGNGKLGFFVHTPGVYLPWKLGSCNAEQLVASGDSEAAPPPPLGISLGFRCDSFGVLLLLREAPLDRPIELGSIWLRRKCHCSRQSVPLRLRFSLGFYFCCLSVGLVVTWVQVFRILVVSVQLYIHSYSLPFQISLFFRKGKKLVLRCSG